MSVKYVDNEGKVHDLDILGGGLEKRIKALEDTVVKITEDLYITTRLSKEFSGYMYPIGAIFETEDDDFNPNNYFEGTWEKIKDRFLFSTGDTYTTSGLTGGEFSQIGRAHV